MASVTDFDLTITGKTGHAARPQDAIDAIAVASEVVNSLQKVVSRRIDPIAPVVITFGSIQGGTARNVIADKVVLNGTARSLTTKAGNQLPRFIKRTADNVCRAHGASCEMNIVGQYPIFANAPEANEILADCYEDLFGHNKIVETEQVLGGEDFARYLERVPGAMFRLGVRNPKIGADKPWHSPQFIVDEEAIFNGTALLVSAVFEALERLRQ
jgi:amidohydrolase